MNIQIVYGSTGGNTQLVCQFVTQQLEAAGFNVNCDRCEHFPVENLIGHDLLILAAPTYEHGQLEDHMRISFWPRIQSLDLQKQACTVIGLGDHKYDTDYHIESARILEKYVLTHNGEMAFPKLMVSRCPLGQLDGLVDKWVQKIIKNLHE